MYGERRKGREKRGEERKKKKKERKKKVGIEKRGSYPGIYRRFRWPVHLSGRCKFLCHGVPSAAGLVLCS